MNKMNVVFTGICRGRCYTPRDEKEGMRQGRSRRRCGLPATERLEDADLQQQTVPPLWMPKVTVVTGLIPGDMSVQTC